MAKVQIKSEKLTFLEFFFFDYGAIILQVAQFYPPGKEGY